MLMSVFPAELLSNRELEVFQLIGHGLKTIKIAEELNLSAKTVETHMKHIRKKMVAGVGKYVMLIPEMILRGPL